MGVRLLGAAAAEEDFIDLISGLRTVEVPFAAPKQPQRVTESHIVRDVLHALQGLPGDTITWNKSKQRFEFNPGTHVSHLSPSSLLLVLKPFISASTSLRKVQKFVAKASKSHQHPTLEAFGNAVSIRLKYIRNFALVKEMEAVQSPPSVTLLNLSANLSWIYVAAKFLARIVKAAVPRQITTYDTSNLSAHILSFLYEALNQCSLLEDGGEEAYRTLLLLFVGSLWPQVQLLDSWLREGSLSDPFGELFFYANSSATIQDTAFWQSGYHFRYEMPREGNTRNSKRFACASFIQTVAKSIISAGKSLQLLRHVQKESGKASEHTAMLSLFDQLCTSLKHLLVKARVQSYDVVGEENNVCRDCSSYQTVSGRCLPSLGDKKLRNAVFTGDDDASQCTNYLLGDGCGRVLRSQIVVDEKAMKKLLSAPTDLPPLDENGDKGSTSMLKWLQQAEFSVTPLSAVIVQECFLKFVMKQVNIVGTQLLQKLMGEWHLMEELALLRALYLMGSGDLLQQFSFVLFNKLDRGEPWDDFYELNTMLQESVRSSADAASYFTLDSLVVKMESRNINAERTPIHHPVHLSGRSPIFGIDILENLRFEYKVAWPLELIIDNDAIKRYNQVMCFLLKVKRAKQALDKACRWMWKGDSAGHKPQLVLQMKLMHFVNTLHHYVMDQVLYSSWLELCENMASARSLDEVIACHDVYLVSIQRQCFVAPDKLWTLISSRVKTILGLALDFYSIQRSIYGGNAGPRSQVEIDNVVKQFDECIAFLLRVLSFKLNVGHFPHLTELINRINYNNYYISESGQLLTPIPELQQQRLKR